MSDPWFAVRELESGVHLIAEPVHVATYVVRGERRAILIDTGLGISNIRKVVEGLTDLEVMVVNTHYHFDHSGGNHHFQRIAIHRGGRDRLAEPVPEEILLRYMTYTRDMLEHFDVYCELDDRFFHFLTEETTPRPLPAGFTPEEGATYRPCPRRCLRRAMNSILADGGCGCSTPRATPPTASAFSTSPTGCCSEATRSIRADLRSAARL
jgi:hypothetical protein